MPKRSKNNFKVNGDTITITREGWESVAFATYREDYYDELTTHTWRLSNGYPSNAKLGGGLHRYMMEKWYGKDVLHDLTDKGYVVDHMNNNHMDCRICNLEFLKHDRNVAKGLQLDKESEQMRSRLAISLYKDFYTGCYQITIGCNDEIAVEDAEGTPHLINEIFLLYNCDYSLVVLDAEAILAEYETSNCITLSRLHHCDFELQEAKIIKLSEEEKDHVIVFRDGIPYVVIGDGKAMIHSVHYKESWQPPE